MFRKITKRVKGLFLRTGMGQRIAEQQRIQRGAAKHGIDVKFGKKSITITRKQESILLAPAHKVYLWDMVNYFDYYHEAVYAVNGVADYSKPSVHRLKKSGIEFEFPSLPEADETTDVYLEHLQLREGNIVLDLGAYAGASCYFFSKRVGDKGVVAAFDPDEQNFKYLQRNIQRHSLKNVRAFPVGLWSSNGTLEFQSEGNMGSSLAAISGRRNRVKLVNVVTLENAIETAGLETVHAIKMDIEGAELEVLRSAKVFLQRHRPRMVIEPHLIEGRLCTEVLCAYLAEIGYSTKLVTQGSISDIPLVVAAPTEPALA